MQKQRKVAATPAPHSWTLRNWPPGVFPGNSDAGRHVVRCNRNALRDAGALARVGRQLVILGAAYSRWLDAQSVRVEGFQIAPNRVSSQQAAR